MNKELPDSKVSVRRLIFLGLVLGMAYLVVGLIWAFTHNDHIAALSGLDKVFSYVGEVAAWPVLIISDITLK